MDFLKGNSIMHKGSKQKQSIAHSYWEKRYTPYITAIKNNVTGVGAGYPLFAGAT